MNFNQLPNDLLWILIAFFGGLARYLDTYLKGQELFSWKRMLATIIVCSFSGYMCAIVAIAIYPTWAMISAGIGGYIGVETLNFIFNLWKSKITGNNNEKKNDSK